MKLSVGVFVGALLLLVTGCAPKIYSPPTMSALLADGSSRSETDIVSEANKIDLNATPGQILSKQFGWRDARTVTWFEESKIAFLKTPNSKTEKKEYLVYDTVSQEVYAVDDEYVISKIDEKVKNSNIDFARVTDKKKSVGGQILGALFSAATCRDYDEKYQGTVTGTDGEGDVSFLKKERMKGQWVKGPFGKMCVHKVESRTCYVQTEKSVDFTGYSVPCIAGNYSFVTEGDKYLVSGDYIYDLQRHEIVPDRVVSQYTSKPPVIVNHALSPSLDKVAILYATPDSYYLEIADIFLDDLIRTAKDGNGLRGDGVEHPVKIYTRVLSGSKYGTLTAWKDRFEFKTATTTEVVPFAEITKVDAGIFSSKVSVKYGEKKLSFASDSFARCGLSGKEEVEGVLKTDCGLL